MWELLKGILWIIQGILWILIAFLTPFWLPIIEKIFNPDYDLVTGEYWMLVLYLLLPITILWIVTLIENRYRKQDLINAIREVLTEAKIIDMRE